MNEKELFERVELASKFGNVIMMVDDMTHTELRIANAELERRGRNPMVMDPLARY